MTRGSKKWARYALYFGWFQRAGVGIFGVLAMLGAGLGIDRNYAPMALLPLAVVITIGNHWFRDEKTWSPDFGDRWGPTAQISPRSQRLGYSVSLGMSMTVVVILCVRALSQP